MNIERFEKDMAVFSFKQHQDVVAYLNRLETSGWTMEDAREWIGRKRKRFAKQTKGIPSPVLPCPLCGNQMNPLPVNINKATQTEDDSKSVWLCQNKQCMHTIYSKQTLEELIKEA